MLENELEIFNSDIFSLKYCSLIPRLFLPGGFELPLRCWSVLIPEINLCSLNSLRPALLSVCSMEQHLDIRSKNGINGGFWRFMCMYNKCIPLRMCTACHLMSCLTIHIYGNFNCNQMCRTMPSMQYSILELSALLH